MPDPVFLAWSSPAAQARMDFAALDRAGAPVRIRWQSTAVHLRHDGDPATAGSVIVTYRDGLA